MEQYRILLIHIAHCSLLGNIFVRPSPKEGKKCSVFPTQVSLLRFLLRRHSKLKLSFRASERGENGEAREKGIKKVETVEKLRNNELRQLSTSSTRPRCVNDARGGGGERHENRCHDAICLFHEREEEKTLKKHK